MAANGHLVPKLPADFKKVFKGDIMLTTTRIIEGKNF
jgi:hypothetical protein